MDSVSGSRVSKNGATYVADMSDYLPPEDEEQVVARIGVTIRFKPEHHEELKLIAAFWNELDSALGRKRRKKWKVSTVVERLVARGIAGFWNELGGRPESSEDRKAFLKRAVEVMRRQQQK